MSKVIRVALPTYDAMTDTDPDHFSLYTDEDWVLIKEFVRGTVSVADGDFEMVTHNFGYVPFVLVYGENGAGKWAGVLGNPFGGYNAIFGLTTTTIGIINLTGARRNFKYYIFYDQI